MAWDADSKAEEAEQVEMMKDVVAHRRERLAMTTRVTRLCDTAVKAAEVRAAAHGLLWEAAQMGRVSDVLPVVAKADAIALDAATQARSAIGEAQDELLDDEWWVKAWLRAGERRLVLIRQKAAEAGTAVRSAPAALLPRRRVVAGVSRMSKAELDGSDLALFEALEGSLTAIETLMGPDAVDRAMKSGA